jgi:hypothetical protein
MAWKPLTTGGRLTGGGGGTFVAVGAGVAVHVCVGVAVAVRVAVGVGDGEGVGVKDGVAVGVWVGVALAVAVAVLVGVLVGSGAVGVRVGVAGEATETESAPKNVPLHVQRPSATIAVSTGSSIFQRSMRSLLRQALERAAGGALWGPEWRHSSTGKLRCQ